MSLLFFSGFRRFLQIGDEGVLQGSAAALFNQFFRRADGEHPPLVHQRDAVAALGFVHEVGRKKDGDPVIAGQINQCAPERVAGDWIDARSGLVEDQHRRPVQHGHRKLQPLFDAKRKAFRLRIGDIFQVVAFEQLFDPPPDLI